MALLCPAQRTGAVHPLTAVSQERQCARGAKELDPCALSARLRSAGKPRVIRSNQHSVSRRLGAVSQPLLSFDQAGGKAPRRCAPDQALRRAQNALSAAPAKRRAREQERATLQEQHAAINPFVLKRQIEAGLK